MNDINSPLDPFVYNNPYFPTDLSRSQYYYQTGGGVEEQVQQIIMQYAELAGTSPEQIVEGLKGLSEEQVQEQLALMAEEIEEAQRQEEMLRRARQQEDEDVSVEEEEFSMFDVYDPEEFEERQNMIMANVQADNNQQMVEEEEEDEPVQQEKTEAQSYREDKYKYGGAKKKFLSKLKKAMNGMAADTLPKVSFDKNDYGQNMLGSFVQGVQKNSQRALEAEAAEKVQETLSQNPQMMMPVMAQYGMQMYNPAATLSENAMGGMDYLRSIAPTNQDIQNSFGNMAGAFANDFLPQQKRGGTLPIFQENGQFNEDEAPIITKDPNDPRIKEYALRKKLYESNVYPPEGVTMYSYDEYKPDAYTLYTPRDTKKEEYLGYDSWALSRGTRGNNDIVDIDSDNRITPKIKPSKFYDAIIRKYIDDPNNQKYSQKTFKNYVLDPNSNILSYSDRPDKSFLLDPETAAKVFDQSLFFDTSNKLCADGHCSYIVTPTFGVPIYDPPGRPVVYDNIGSISKEWGRNWKSTESGKGAPPRPGMNTSNANTVNPDDFGYYYQIRFNDGKSKILTPEEYEQYKTTEEYINHENIINAEKQRQQRLRDERRNRISSRKLGGSLPTFQNTGENNLKQQGRDYFRKIWERTQGINVDPNNKDAEFDKWYAGQKVEDWKDILPQAPGGNYFNQAPTNQMFNNPWGYRAYNNPYLQQFAYAPRYKASVDGKKININNLQDWSDANLIQTEQMTNRRGRVTGTRYKLQKPFSIPPVSGTNNNSGTGTFNSPEIRNLSGLKVQPNTNTSTGQGSEERPEPKFSVAPNKQSNGGQLYLYRNGGLPKFQLAGGKYANEFNDVDPYNFSDQYNETLDITETYRPNFLQGVARGIPYMNFANNIYDRIFAENQRAKIRERATSIESTATPFADYKGRFSEYGAYQPNLQGFQGMGSAQYGGMIGDGEYYLSDSEIQDIINMGGEVEFLED